MADKSTRADVREDEEQGVKFQEIVDLLLAAGYFRARIKGLSPFDKVVGGMTWCIEVCNMDIDVDLLFHENLTIGQKISLTEKIVAALKKMQCPHRLEPHQVQGLDFIHVFPVIQWLVKRAIETREETGDTIRAHSIYQFDQTHRSPEDFDVDKFVEPAKEAVAVLLDVYGPKRRYRRSDGRNLDREELKVQSTLLEYGIGLGFFYSDNSEKSKAERRPSRSGDSETSIVDVQERERQFNVAMKSMTAAENTEKLTASSVGLIVGLQSDEIRKISSEYAEKQAELANLDFIVDGSMETLRQNRLLSSVQNQTKLLQVKIEDAERRNEELRQQHTEHLKKLKEVENHRDQLETEMKDMESIETEENHEILKKLQSLVALNENLKSQEQIFRAHCKEELVRLQASLDSVKSNDTEDDQEDDERSQLIEKHYQTDKDKLQKLRLLLARKNREIATLQRKLDEVPTRAELGQYQQRFLELYNQVAAKHKETKQFFTFYNTLDDTKLYLSKEVNLLNSILDNFSEAMQSNSTKQQFLKQFEGIVDGVNQNKLKLERKKQEEKMRRDQLNDTYLDFVEKQRIYFKTVKDFKEECRKNELLLSKLKGHRQ